MQFLFQDTVFWPDAGKRIEISSRSRASHHFPNVLEP
jgi:hypothetical protein